MAAFAACGGGGKNDPDPPDCVGVKVGEICRSPDLTGTGAGTDWHPDPDGDGIVTEDDGCPYVYDPDQADADGDGTGDMCDPDATNVVENGPINDFRAEHVTPYGGWFTFTSVRSAQYGYSVDVAWSTDRTKLESASAIESLPEDSKDRVKLYERFGKPLRRPAVITSMEPATRYYVTARRVTSSGSLAEEASPIIEITTAAAPRVTRGGSSPRAWATAEELAALQQRHMSGDATFNAWATVMGDEAIDVADQTELYVFGYCLSAAYLYHATADSRYRDAALQLIENMRGYWDGTDLTRNQLRWADASLGACADIMWDELSDSQRNAVVSAFLQDDELADIDRMDDTDEFSSIARTWITDGLVGCEAPGVSSDLSQRACALLDRGLRLFYGVQLVKARRDRGFFAQSGGNLPDGNGYGRGTSQYWLHTFLALGSAGAPVHEYAPWIWHNLLSMELHALTPKSLGYATFGDLDSYDNFDVEPNSLPLNKTGGALVALHMGLLARAGFDKEAGYARHQLGRVYSRLRASSGWAMVLFDHDGLPEVDYREDLSTTYFDSGMGMLYDRSSWKDDASFLVFRSGWSGVDHSQEDLGSFQLYRNGTWVTHEALGYDGAASEAIGHNVMQIDLAYGDTKVRPGQYTHAAEGNARIRRLSSTSDYTYVASEETGAYNSGSNASFGFDKVERHLLWLKPAAPGGQDRVVVYDLVDSSADNTSTKRRWQLHLDKAPSIDGTSATYQDSAGSDIQIDVVVPSGAGLSVEDPAGAPNEYPGEVYNYRLIANPNTDDPNLRMVSLLRASTAEGPSLTKGVESTDAVGVLTGSDLVVFPRTVESASPGAMSVTIETATPVTVWWAALAPSTDYELSTSYDGTNLTITVKPGAGHTTDVAGLLVGRADLP